MNIALYGGTFDPVHLGHIAVARAAAERFNFGRVYFVPADIPPHKQKQPLTAALFTVFLLSLIGVPLTGGFFGKFYIFKAALESHLVWLTVLGLLNSAVAA